MQINLGKGLDRITFGISKEELIDLLGKPDKITGEERRNYLVLYYNNIMTKFFSLLIHMWKIG